MEEKVILVDVLDKEIGQMEKLEAHKLALLHRAFSIFIFNDKKEMLLQQRAENKYHSSLLWTNTCCSHPRPGETNLEAAHRRLMEEMGFDCKLEPKFNFIYKTELDNGIFENELDHVFSGIYNEKIHINKDEANNYKWVSMEEVTKEVELHPENFTVWFTLIIKNHAKKLAI